MRIEMAIAFSCIAPLLMASVSISDNSKNESLLTVIYDNNPYDNRLKTAWGFSCLVNFNGRCILFDTGGDGPTLLSNMEKLQIDPGPIEAVVLSHIHGDHVGGLPELLEKNSHLTVYLLESFPKDFKDKVKAAGAKFCEVSKSIEIEDDSDVYTTGEVDGRIKEQALVMKAKAGLVIITGCAHPGVVNMVRKAKEIFEGKEEVLLVMGGFHLGSTGDAGIKEIISSFKEMGVQYVGPSHCSGDKARQLFKDAYGKKFLEIGAGKKINLTQIESIATGEE